MEAISTQTLYLLKNLKTKAMEYWIKDGELLTWLDPNRRIQEVAITRGVIDADYNSQLGEWLVVRRDGTVESLVGHLQTVDNVYSRDGLTVRWSGSNVVVRESDGRSRVYDHRGFLQTVL
jgi:hypothetical protein